MVQQLVSESIVYPESDGLPLADNTVQFRLITTIHGGLDALLEDTFVAADLLWYPIEGDPTTSAAPDVMVAFGRPKGERRSYKQWEEENVAPQVVFEIASLSNTLKELEDKKFEFYREHGVEEYYLFDPDRQTLKGWLRDTDSLDEGSSDEGSSDRERFQPIAEMNGWVSPRLKVRFEVEDGELQLYRPDGELFAPYAEIIQQKRQERERAESERIRADRAQEIASSERNRADRAEEIAESERTKARLFAERLRELGVNPEDLL
ncbi:MAG: Uma2 family endonuclease [Cyanobacteriota bacterium]|nr:Uma2 family endonuclease [Cyanobacteriota bacterium]